jgi:hypothetical protein
MHVSPLQALGCASASGSAQFAHGLQETADPRDTPGAVAKNHSRKAKKEKYP